jgi:hypothetical protein
MGEMKFLNNEKNWNTHFARNEYETLHLGGGVVGVVLDWSISI